MAYVQFEIVGVTKAEIRNYAIDSSLAAACRYAFQLWLPHARVETCDLQVKLIIADDRCERNGRRDELLRGTLKRRSYQFPPITPTWQRLA